MSLFPPQSSSKSHHFLALAAAHDLRLFTLSLRELNAKSISVNLVVLYKISMDSVPDFVMCLKPLAYGVGAGQSAQSTCIAVFCF
jgi:hypothetical protein